jgi:hypothetical protein
MPTTELESIHQKRFTSFPNCGDKINLFVGDGPLEFQQKFATRLTFRKYNCPKSINQSINQSIYRTIDQIINQAINQSINPSRVRSADGLINKLTNQSINRLMNRHVIMLFYQVRLVMIQP